MPEYLRPDVYTRRTNNTATPLASSGTSTAVFFGEAKRGTIGKPVLVTSWNQYLSSEFVVGLDTPFSKHKGYLSHAVLGFFQNGGSRLYIVRVGSDDFASATATIEATEPDDQTAYASFLAKGEGTWANGKLSIEITANEDDPTLFDLTVLYNADTKETFTGLSNDVDSDNYWVDGVSTSKYIVGAGGDLKKTEDNPLIFDNGTESATELEDKDYLNTLSAIDNVECNLVSVIGRASLALNQGVLEYCERTKRYAILDAPSGIETTDLLEYKKQLVGNNGAIYTPWGKIVDPLGTNNSTKLVPPAGYIAGLYARTDNSRGVHKAPAGIEAIVKGFVGLEKEYTDGEVELLNPKNINCILNKTNYGIVVWGSRNVTPFGNDVYVPDTRLALDIETTVKRGTLWAVFEPIDDSLFKKVTGQINAYLYSLWKSGALKGSTSAEAYYVICDSTNNPEETQNLGQLHIKLGVAKKKPAEFVIIEITQSASN